MKKLTMLVGLLTIVAAGTTSAQTRVAVSIGFGVPRPYIAGDVFIGESFVRPVYRPYYYYYPNRYPYYFYEPLPFRYGRPYRVIIFERGHRFYRREFDRERSWRRDWSRRHRGRDWDWRRDGDGERDRDRDWDRHRRDHDHDDNR